MKIRQMQKSRAFCRKDFVIRPVRREKTAQIFRLEYENHIHDRHIQNRLIYP
ncbi:MAG: hypothetical protein ACTTJV_09840 [Ottowia sp.]